MLYTYNLIFCFNIVNILLLFVALEAISWIFSFFLKGRRLKYLLVQRLFFLGSLLRAIIFYKIVFLFFFLKLGMPPFYSWVVLLITNTNKIVFLFFFLIHKVVPLLFLAKTEIPILIFLMVLRISLLAMIQLSSLLIVFIMSSIIQSLWILFCLLISVTLFLIYWLCYSRVLFIFFYSFKRTYISILSQIQNISRRVLWLVITGLPPFLIFWLKLSLLTSILYILGLIISIILLLSSVLRIIVYYRVFNRSIKINRVNKTSIIRTYPFLILFF